MLKGLNIDLDGDSCSQDGGMNSNLVEGKCPKTRVTGMQLELTTSFYNLALHKNSGLVLAEVEPTAIIEVAPKLTWNSLGNDIRTDDDPKWAEGTSALEPTEMVNKYRYGITVRFKNVTGKIGRFDFFLLITAALQLFVLMGVATTVTSYIAKFCMCGLSGTYRAVISEQMSIGRELSRFACQALIANFVLGKMDDNETLSISQDEIKANMSTFFTKTLGLTDVDACSQVWIDILNHQAGEEHRYGASSVAPAQDPYIDIMMLIDSMTDDRITVDLLKQAMEDRLNPDDGSLVRKISLGILPSVPGKEVNRQLEQ